MSIRLWHAYRSVETWKKLKENICFLLDTKVDYMNLYVNFYQNGWVTFCCVVIWSSHHKKAFISYQNFDILQTQKCMTCKNSASQLLCNEFFSNFKTKHNWILLPFCVYLTPDKGLLENFTYSIHTHIKIKSNSLT